MMLAAEMLALSGEGLTLEPGSQGRAGCSPAAVVWCPEVRLRELQ